MTAVIKLEIANLKRLQNVEINLPESGVVALMGENGAGKSTVLHALACLYKPDQYTQQGYVGRWWTDFFIPHTGNLWEGSALTVHFADGLTNKYKKDSKWIPLRKNRKERYNRFIGILECAPHVERETVTARFSFTERPYDLSPNKKQQLLDDASYVLNRRYTDIVIGEKNWGAVGRFLMASTDGRSYLSHYMGAGEQKIFQILDAIIRAPNNGLIIIEELEVSLHDRALRRLIGKMCEIAQNKNLQIIFSTHWPQITEFQDLLAIRTLQHQGGQSFCLEGFSPSSLYQITEDEQHLRRINLWTEDTLAQKIAKQVAQELGINQNIKFNTYGAAQNAFTVAGSLALEGHRIDTSIVLLDGDKFETDELKSSHIRNSVNGTGSHMQALWDSTLGLIKQFDAPVINAMYGFGLCRPEAILLHATRDALTNGAGFGFVQQYIDFADGNVFSDPDKSVIWNIAQHFGLSLEGVEQYLVQAASASAIWGFYTLSLRQRLTEIAQQLNLQLREAV
ncbi:hypothetical protein GCM10011332_29340 [Terasakiella brassicae]|uniref:AAA+ ATPase domain-containing protein n=1 Tax=Terasakiella brassicae TaxID=1634917 RepID=A0A917C5W7_9PROT|nr:AAA family ATPase [Terasakiella brassicae]GGF73405.1 hypothetical protein GCM10011332_29340 [Terasakiella brassicae]